MNQPGARPFYNEYAWAYDLLIPAPESSQVDFISNTLAERGCSAGSRLLDAGCGTGRYAIELARRGYIVSGVDASAPFVELARARAKDVAPEVSFSIGNILELTTNASYDAVLCRGVLNDVVDVVDRQKVFISFHKALRHAGVLILDVRNWETSAASKRHEPVVEKEVDTPRGTLRFRSETRLNEATHQLLVTERHVLKTADGETASSFEFRMRCWTVGELNRALSDSGFEGIELFGAYEVGAQVGPSDRIVCASQRS